MIIKHVVFISVILFLIFQLCSIKRNKVEINRIEFEEKRIPLQIEKMRYIEQIQGFSEPDHKTNSIAGDFNPNIVENFNLKSRKKKNSAVFNLASESSLFFSDEL